MTGISSDDKALLAMLTRSRRAVAETAETPRQQRLIGPILAEIDRTLAALDPDTVAAAPLTPLHETTPVPPADIEALLREVERLRAIAQGERGLARAQEGFAEGASEDPHEALKLAIASLSESFSDEPLDEVSALRREVGRLRQIARGLRSVLDTVVNYSPHGMLVSNALGALTLQNRASEKIWAGSATAANVEGWGKYRAFHADGRPYEAGDWSMARCLSQGVTIDAEEVHFQRFDGTHGILLGSCAPVRGPNNEVIGAVSTFADITHFKQMEEALRVSEARLATTLKSIGDAVIATDALGRVEFMNAVASETIGKSLQVVKGKGIDELFRLLDGSTREPVESLVSCVLRDKFVVGLTGATIVRRDGSEVTVDASCAPIREDSGELIGVVLVLRDVTEKRRAEERRHFINEASWHLASLALDYESTLRSVAESAVPRLADWCFVDLLESDGTVNRAAVAHVDPAKSIVATQLKRRYPARASNTEAVVRVARSGQPEFAGECIEPLIAAAELAGDFTAVEAWQTLSPQATMIVPLRARDHVLGALSFVCAESCRSFGPDDLALAQQFANTAALAIDNARLYREAQQVNRIKDEFLATLSHELRTPLNAILGWSRLMRTGKLDDKGRERALETIERNAQSQAQLIEDLLDVSRIISGKFRVEERTVEIRKVIDAAIDSVRLAADARGISLKTELRITGTIKGDPTRLQQVVWNLLSNAIKFTPRGGCVAVELEQIDNIAEIRVKDDGQGIPPEFLPCVFDRFRQADGTTTRAHNGLGLGLAIVRHLVELHGGTVRAESGGKDQGSTFTVRLPLASARSNVVESSIELEPVSFPPSLEVPPPLHGVRVLVVDDELDARELVATVLIEHGAGVTTVGSVSEALAAIEEHRPDVLVSDIGMPSEDGYTLIRRVRAMEKRWGRIPAAALTAYAGAQDRTRALLAGYSSHLPKPIEPAELAAVVANLAGRTARL